MASHEWKPSIQDVSIYLRNSSLARSKAVLRTYASAADITAGDPTPDNEALLAAVRTFFVSGAKPFKSDPDKPKAKKSKQESQDGLDLLIRSAAITVIEEEKGSRYVWSTLVAEQFFFMKAFPCHRVPAGYKPKSVKDFFMDSLAYLDGKRLQGMHGLTSADGHIIETAIQECVYSVFAACTPRDWVLCPERRIGGGRIDYQVNGWGIELLVEGHLLPQHIEKTSPIGKYALPGLQQYLVANFYTGGKPSATATKQVEDNMGLQPDNCFYVSVVIEKDFEKATVYTLDRASDTWIEETVRLNKSF